MEVSTVVEPAVWKVFSTCELAQLVASFLDGIWVGRLSRVCHFIEEALEVGPATTLAEALKGKEDLSFEDLMKGKGVFNIDDVLRVKWCPKLIIRMPDDYRMHQKNEFRAFSVPHGPCWYHIRIMNVTRPITIEGGYTPGVGPTGEWICSTEKGILFLDLPLDEEGRRKKRKVGAVSDHRLWSIQYSNVGHPVFLSQNPSQFLGVENIISEPGISFTFQADELIKTANISYHMMKFGKVFSGVNHFLMHPDYGGKPLALRAVGATHFHVTIDYYPRIVHIPGYEIQ